MNLNSFLDFMNETALNGLFLAGILWLLHIPVLIISRGWYKKYSRLCNKFLGYLAIASLALIFIVTTVGQATGHYKPLPADEVDEPDTP